LARDLARIAKISDRTTLGFTRVSARLVNGGFPEVVLDLSPVN
jgi:hypothetical protein